MDETTHNKALNSGQEQSRNCGKCKETSKKCDDTKAQLKAMINQNQKLDKKLALLEKEEAKKPREQLEKELKEKLKRLEELRKRNQQLEESKNVSEPKIEALEASVSASRFKMRQIADLNVEKEKHIRILKEHVPGDVLSGIQEKFENLRF